LRFLLAKIIIARSSGVGKTNWKYINGECFMQEFKSLEVEQVKYKLYNFIGAVKHEKYLVFDEIVLSRQKIRGLSIKKTLKRVAHVGRKLLNEFDTKNISYQVIFPLIVVDFFNLFQDDKDCEEIHDFINQFKHKV